MADLKALVAAVAALDCTEDEKVAALAAASMEMGFDGHLKSALAAAEPSEKTASVSKKIAGREVTFSKMSFEDLMAHLTSQYSVPADHDVEEKTSAPTPREKLAAFIEAELTETA
jgi:hypothetical protein